MSRTPGDVEYLLAQVVDNPLFKALGSRAKYEVADALKTEFEMIAQKEWREQEKIKAALRDSPRSQVDGGAKS